MLPLRHMGTWRGDIWGHGGGDPDGHVGAQRGDIWGRGGRGGGHHLGTQKRRSGVSPAVPLQGVQAAPRQRCS